MKCLITKKRTRETIPVTKIVAITVGKKIGFSITGISRFSIWCGSKFKLIFKTFTERLSSFWALIKRINIVRTSVMKALAANQKIWKGASVS